MPVSRSAESMLRKSGYFSQHPLAEIVNRQWQPRAAGNFARGVRLRRFTEIRGIVDEELEGSAGGAGCAQALHKTKSRAVRPPERTEFIAVSILPWRPMRASKCVTNGNRCRSLPQKCDAVRDSG